jgi:hypothetical protein
MLGMYRFWGLVQLTQCAFKLHCPTKPGLFRPEFCRRLLTRLARVDSARDVFLNIPKLGYRSPVCMSPSRRLLFLFGTVLALIIGSWGPSVGRFTVSGVCLGGVAVQLC